MIGRIFASALMLLMATQVHAACRDDLKDIKPRIDHMKIVDKGRYDLASLWWGRAREAEAGSESACLNFLAKARKALYASLTELCDGPNFNLPQCRNGGVAFGESRPLGDIGASGGGGGGGAATPVGPVMATQPVSPPCGGCGASKQAK
jgi:hypothetical protein